MKPLRAALLFAAVAALLGTVIYHGPVVAPHIRQLDAALEPWRFARPDRALAALIAACWLVGVVVWRCSRAR